MHLLTPPDYERVSPVLTRRETESHMALVYAVLEGTMPGKVFVDDASEIRTLLVCNLTGFWFVFGEPTPAFFDFVPELMDVHLNDEPTALFATSRAWETALDAHFSRKITRLGFHFSPRADAPPLDYRSRVPEAFRLVALDPTLAARLGADGMDPWIVRSWGGPQAFGSRVFGFALVDGARLLSFCTACGIGGGEAEIEIGTAPEFEGRGLATIVGAAFVEDALSRGLTPAWTCDSRNLGSLAVARKLGFVPSEAMAGYTLQKPRPDRVLPATE
ncbi:MAG: GNAT family N-acetyltransferase [Anaerolineae bacterium]